MSILMPWRWGQNNDWEKNVGARGLRPEGPHVYLAQANDLGEQIKQGRLGQRPGSLNLSIKRTGRWPMRSKSNHEPMALRAV